MTARSLRIPGHCAGRQKPNGKTGVLFPQLFRRETGGCVPGWNMDRAVFRGDQEGRGKVVLTEMEPFDPGRTITIIGSFRVTV